MKKMITMVTAASLLVGSMATPVYAATFADIDTVTWSGFKPFLNQAADLGLMNGYNENGKKYCKPRNNVTYCEAVQLMYSIMKVYAKQDVNDATVAKWKPVISAYNIPTWAYPATAYGLENSILTTAELNKLQGGTKAANREDVGVIFGKALDTVKGYDIKSGATLGYKDKASVSAAAVPYLELLYRSNLMVGDAENKFNPKANITRAEMAVLSVKSYNKLVENKVEVPDANKEVTAAGTVITSMVMQNGDLFLSLKTNSGTGLSLFGTKGKATAKYNGEKISFSDIGEGDTVKVAYQGTQISSVEVTYSKAGLNLKTEKTFELEDLSGSWITVLDGKKELEYRLDDSVKVELNGRSSTVKKLEAAMEDAHYDVTLTLDKDERVLKIVAKLNDNNPTEGLVTDVSEDQITIEVGSREYTYPLAEDVEIEYNGKSIRFSKFEDEYEDNAYEVSMTLNKDCEVDEISIKSMEDEYNGTLTRITSKRVEFTSGRDEYAYDFADDVVVKIDGKKSSVDTLKDNFRGDEKAYTVSVKLNKYDEVTELLATAKFSSNSKGTLDFIDEDEIKIKAGGKSYTYDLAKDVDVTINGKNRDVEDLVEYMDIYGFDVELAFDKSGDVKEIKATMEQASEGELRYIDKDVLSIRAADMTLELDLASSVDITLDGEDMTISELDAQLDYAYGDSRIYVELKYNSSGKVTKITAHWEDVFGELTDVDDDDERITVKVGSKTEKYYLSRKVKVSYQLSGSVDKDDYKTLSRYGDDLDGLMDFWEDCDDARDDCMVTLTLDSDREVIRIKAMAK